MKDNISHRSEDDTQWQETKEKCRKRDKNMCAICRMLTPGEYMVFMKSHPAYIQTIDVAFELLDTGFLHGLLKNIIAFGMPNILDRVKNGRRKQKNERPL